MRSVIPNAHRVSLCARARIRVSRKPRLLHAETGFGPLVLEHGAEERDDFGREADAEGGGFCFADGAGRCGAAVDVFLDTEG